MNYTSVTKLITVWINTDFLRIQTTGFTKVKGFAKKYDIESGVSIRKILGNGVRESSLQMQTSKRNRTIVGLLSHLFDIWARGHRHALSNQPEVSNKLITTWYNGCGALRFYCYNGNVLGVYKINYTWRGNQVVKVTARSITLHVASTYVTAGKQISQRVQKVRTLNCITTT